MTETPAKKSVKPRPPKWKVRRVDTDQPDHAATTNPLVEFSSEGPARRHIETNYPRGREVFLENPDGSREHYSQDTEYQGDDGWVTFDPEETE